MKILILGSSGFIGKAVVETLKLNHEIFKGDRASDGHKNSLVVDLLDHDSVFELLNQVKPEVIINCAGTVENSEKALEINPVITLNILQSVLLAKIPVKKVIISGSAGEYGIVKKTGPVDEDVPLMGTSFYARSKIMESSVARSFADLSGIPVVIARIFNPIGAGMHPRFLLPNLIKQGWEIKAGERKTVELSRLDAMRDYINVLDIAEAIKLIAENDCPQAVYNIGSGNPITNGQLMEGILEQLGVELDKVSLVETSVTPEPNYAVHADITRMNTDFGWKPKYDIATTINQVAAAISAQEEVK